MPPPECVLSPPRTVNPLSMAARVSPDRKLTTDPAPRASIIVRSGPSSLLTVIAFPRKLIVSKYVPGATRTVSPLIERSMADWIVEASAGTLITVSSIGHDVEGHGRL